MLKNQYWCILLALISNFKACVSQRRIVNGTRVWGEPRFMAYFVKSELSERSYQGWTCGGAIISPLHILTAAACVMDVDHLYAIVGYNKYVNAEELHDDPCTRNRKKKVVNTCAPKSYSLQKSGWTSHDIGVATLESPLDFTDATYKIDCSYPPALIKVNFDPIFEKPDTDVVAMGWGHSEKLRMPHHLQDHNEEYLRETSLLIVEKDICLKKIAKPLEESLLCVQGAGNIDSKGEVIVEAPYRSKCDDEEEEETPSKDNPTTTTKKNNKNNTTTIITTTNKPNGPQDPTTTNAKKRVHSITANKLKNKKSEQQAPNHKTAKRKKKAFRRNDGCLENTLRRLKSPSNNKPHKSVTSKPKPTLADMYDNDSVYEDAFEALEQRKRSDTKHANRRSFTRRQGLCQNDHGGPLVTWMGLNPIVIGVASTNLYNKNFSCIPPNLFTSTRANEWFIKCAVKEDLATVRRCQEIELREGSTINELSSNWVKQTVAAVAPILNLQRLVNSYIASLNLPRGKVNYQPQELYPPILRQGPEKTLQPPSIKKQPKKKPKNSHPAKTQVRYIRPKNSSATRRPQKLRNRVVKKKQNHQNVQVVKRVPVVKQKMASRQIKTAVTPSNSAVYPKRDLIPQPVQSKVKITRNSRQKAGAALIFRPQKDIVANAKTTQTILRAAVPIQLNVNRPIQHDVIQSFEDIRPRWRNVDWSISYRRDINDDQSYIDDTITNSTRISIFTNLSHTPKTYKIRRFKWRFDQTNQSLT